MSPIQSIANGRANVFYVDRKYIHNEPGFNIVRDLDYGGDPEKVAKKDPDLVKLARQIAKHGIRIPTNGSMVKGRIRLSGGHRRNCALNLAITRKWLDRHDPRARVPVLADPQNHGRADRLVDSLVLNDGKPASIMGQARCFKELIEVHGYLIQPDAKHPEKPSITESIGCSKTHVANCLLLLAAAPELQRAVTAGTLAATTAIDMAREMSHEEQVAALEEATPSADGKITQKNLKVKVGRARRAASGGHRDDDASEESSASESASYAPSPDQPSTLNHQPFPDATPDTPVTNHDGDFVEGFEEYPIVFCSSKVHAKLYLVEETDPSQRPVHFMGYQLQHPAKARGEGFKLIRPRRDQRAYESRNHAIIAGLLHLRAELELADFRDRQLSLDDLDDQLTELTKGMPRKDREMLLPRPPGSAGVSPAVAGVPPTTPQTASPARTETQWARDLATHLNDLLNALTKSDPKLPLITRSANTFLTEYATAHPEK